MQRRHTSIDTDVPGSPTISFTISFTSQPITSLPSTLRSWSPRRIFPEALAGPFGAIPVMKTSPLAVTPNEIPIPILPGTTADPGSGIRLQREEGVRICRKNVWEVCRKNVSPRRTCRESALERT